MTMLISKLKGPASIFNETQGNMENPSILQRIVAVLFFVNGRLARHRSRKDLVALDDRMLKDIGVTRWQAEEEIKRDFWK